MAQLVLFALVVLAVLGIRRFLSNTPLARYSPTQQSLMALGILLLLLLTLTGRLGVLVPVLGAVLAALFATVTRILPVLIPLIVQYLPHWHRYKGQRSTNPGQVGAGDDATGSSTVESDFLRMDLHHATGELSGEILQGSHAGKSLKNLSLTDLASLYRSYAQQDPESARLLAAYIERVYGDRWRESEQASHGNSGDLALDHSEALQMLGLQPGATREDIIAAHRRLIQKVHPDRGGSDCLAAKINQAKDTLLGG